MFPVNSGIKPQKFKHIYKLPDKNKFWELFITLQYEKSDLVGFNHYVHLLLIYYSMFEFPDEI
jgi:hypothetical protein